MRIAWTGPVAATGGVPGMGKLLVEELVRQGVEVDVYLPLVGSETPALESSPGLRIIARRSRWEWGRWYSRTNLGAFVTGLAARALVNVRLSVRLLAEHHRRPYDAVYQLSITELLLLGRLRRWAPPIVVHPCVHAAGELRWHRAEQAYALRSERRRVHLLARAVLTVRSRLQPKELARADLVLGLSERFNGQLRADYAVPDERLRVLRTPVDLRRFSPNGHLPDGRARTLLFVSRISARKGVEEVIELSHRLSDLSRSVQILVIGGPTQWSDYTRHLAGLNPEVAEYLGAVASEELATLMCSASMLIVPSRYEPGSITTAEALACGLPVVLSDEVGNAEVVSGPHARVHQAGDVDDLEAAVRSLLAALERDEPRLREAARRNAEAHFAPSKVVEALIELLGEPRSQPSHAPPHGPVASDRVTAWR